MGHIYKITNIINNMIYVGQTIQSIEKRFKSHKNNIYKLNTNLAKAMRKFGIENFSIELLEECENDKLDERENYWIRQYRSMTEGYNMQYNYWIENNNDKQIQFIYKDDILLQIDNNIIEFNEKLLELFLSDKKIELNEFFCFNDWMIPKSKHGKQIYDILCKYTDKETAYLIYENYFKLTHFPI